MSDRVTVFLLDDHEIVRRGVRDLLEAENDFAVVGEASTEEEAVRRIPALDPDGARPRARAGRRGRSRGKVVPNAADPTLGRGDVGLPGHHLGELRRRSLAPHRAPRPGRAPGPKVPHAATGGCRGRVVTFGPGRTDPPAGG